MEPVTWLEWLSTNPLAVAVFALSAVIAIVGKAFWTHVMIPVKDAVILHLVNTDKHMKSHTDALNSLVDSNEKVSTTLDNLCRSSECQAQYINELRTSLMER